MTEQQNDVYKLYAMGVKEKDILQAEGYRFHRVTPTYSLVYTKEATAPERSVEITEENLYRLTERDVEWLFACARETIEEKLEAEREKVAERLEGLIDSLEEELRAEKMKLEEGGEADGPEQEHDTGPD